MKKKYIITSIVLLICSIVFTILLTKVDVKSVGVDREVGFSTLNNKLTFSYNETIYKVTEVLGYVALLIPVVYAGIGLLQLIKRKSIKKIDKELFILAGFYAIVLLTYIFFEKVVINYRPVMLDGEFEASYPSSHTLMSLFFGISAIILNKKLFKDKTKLINIGLLILSLSIVIGRYISGVHWFTDIVGSIFIASTLLTAFASFISNKQE